MFSLITDHLITDCNIFRLFYYFFICIYINDEINQASLVQKLLKLIRFFKLFVFIEIWLKITCQKQPVSFNQYI